MKWLVLGGAGFTGKFVIERLLDQFSDIEIIVADIQEIPNTSITSYKMNLTESNQIKQILREVNPNYIINLAGIFKSDNILKLLKINCLILAQICEFYKNNSGELKKILVIGSAAQYGEISSKSSFPKESSLCHPSNIYGWTKLLQEKIGLEYHRKYSIPVAFTRTANLIGPGLSSEFVVPTILKQIIDKMKNDEKLKIQLMNINSGRDFIDVRDAVKAYIEIVLNPDSTGDVFNVGSGRLTMLSQIIQETKQILNIKELEIEAQSSDLPDIHALDCKKIQETLNWFLDFNLRDSLRDMINEMNKNKF